MANVLKLEKNNSGNFQFIAKDDIDVGKTILIEKPFSAHSSTDFSSRCNNCIQENTNLLPYNYCTHAMFCIECKNSLSYK